MKVLIASPSYDGSVRKEYMRSIMVLTDYFRQAGIAWQIRLDTASLLHVMRNAMATDAMLDADTTHLLFVDTDMGFDVSIVQKLIAAKKDVIGCVYPYRSLPLNDEVGDGAGRLRDVISRGVPYAVEMPPKSQVEVQGGVCEVLAIGTGLLLIGTDVLRTMSAKVKRFRFKHRMDWYKHDHYYGFFDYVSVGDRQLSEDFSFCYRWTHGCGGKIHGLVDQEVTHVGPMPVVGRYIDRMKDGKL